MSARCPRSRRGSRTPTLCRRYHRRRTLFEVACWVHCRRKLFEAHAATSSAVAQGARTMTPLFKIEAEIPLAVARSGRIRMKTVAETLGGGSLEPGGAGKRGGLLRGRRAPPHPTTRLRSLPPRSSGLRSPAAAHHATDARDEVGPNGCERFSRSSGSALSGTWLLGDGSACRFAATAWRGSHRARARSCRIGGRRASPIESHPGDVSAIEL